MKPEPLFIDFETASTVDLKKAGLYNYARHSSTFIWCMGFVLGDEPAADIWYGNQPFPDRIKNHVAAGGLVVAHNAPFEINIWNAILAARYGLPSLSPEQCECTMARCYAMSLPPALVDAAPALGIRTGKDEEGHRLMLRMCKPVRWEGSIPLWLPQQKQFTFLGQRYPGAWALQRLGTYCKIDVDVEREVYRRTVALSAKERQVWQMDFEINNRGVMFDQQTLNAALQMKDQIVEELNAELNQITKGVVPKHTSLIALRGWITERTGLEVQSLDKNAIEEWLAREDLPPDVKRAVEIRKLAGRSTSVAKLEAINALAGPDGRVRNLFQYHGAGPGRWAGRGVQPHNMPRDLPQPETVDEMIEIIRSGNIRWLDALYDTPLTVISQVLRAFIVPGPGNRLMAGDWSNVEGRGIAWLAGEEWKLQAFRDADANPDGPDVYEQTYARVFDVPVESVAKDDRQVGKVIELSAGYQGWVGAFHRMGEVYGVHVEDDFAARALGAWRDAHPRIRQYWHNLEWAAIDAVIKPGTVTCEGAPGREVRFRKVGSFLWVLLPSARVLCYPYPVVRTLLVHDKPKTVLTYMTVPSADDRKSGRIVEDPKNTNRFAYVSTYGGKWSENITQAICRDILTDAMLLCESVELPVVFHVHDEPMVEGRFNEDDLTMFKAIMNKSPTWAPDFPVVADCWLADRYIKA